MSGLKTCPFCKKLIPKNSLECPICKRIVAEKIETTKKLEQDEREPPTSSEQYIFSKKRKEWFSKGLNEIKRPINLIFFLILSAIFYFIFFQNDKKTIDEEIRTKSNETHNYKDVTYNNGSKKNDDIDRSYNSLNNGTVLKQNKRILNGLGILTIKNGSSFDAVLKLVNLYIKKSVFTVYIRKGHDFSIHNISDGKYKVLFNLGNDWDNFNNEFKVDINFLEFDENFYFETVKKEFEDHSENEYSTYTITLHPVIGGQARTHTVPKKVFDLY